MSDFIKYNQCPGCLHTNIVYALSCKDYTVSKEVFEIWECNNCTIRFTQNIPGPAAIAKYYQSTDYISHSNTKKGLINKVYHAVRNHTLNTKRKLIQHVTGKEKGDLLDVGAGTGAFAHAMYKAGWVVKGLEPDETARTNAQNNYQIQLDTLDSLYKMPANSFDAITMWHVLEHVHDLQGYLTSFSSILKAKGKLVVAVPNYTSKDAQMYLQHWAAYDVPRHLYHFSPKSIGILLDSKGFKLTDTRPMWFDSFYVSMLSEKYKTGSQNILKAFQTGAISNIKALSNTNKCSSIIYIAEKK